MKVFGSFGGLCLWECFVCFSVFVWVFLAVVLNPGRFRIDFIVLARLFLLSLREMSQSVLYFC